MLAFHLWCVNPNFLLRGFLDAENMNPDNMNRVLDLCQELKVIFRKITTQLAWTFVSFFWTLRVSTSLFSVCPIYFYLLYMFLYIEPASVIFEEYHLIWYDMKDLVPFCKNYSQNIVDVKYFCRSSLKEACIWGFLCGDAAIEEIQERINLKIEDLKFLLITWIES